MRFLRHIALLLLVLAVAQQATAAVVDIGKVKYSLDDKTGEATAIGIATNLSDWDGLEIPDFVTYNDIDYPVTTIVSKAFQGKSSFKGSLVIGNNVTKIRDYAFSNCGFNGTLTLGDNVQTIGECAFADCSGFTGSLIIGNNVQTIDQGAFLSCSGFNESLIIGDNVQTIRLNAFAHCSGFTGSLTIGDNVQSIGSHAFESCSGFTDSLIIGDKVYSIGTSAFANCSGFTGSLTIGKNVHIIGEAAFDKCSQFTGSLVIGDNVQIIEDRAFRSCLGFTGSLVIGDNVQSIGQSAFINCRGFNGSLVIGDKVYSIGHSAFADCSGFTGSLTIGDNVQSIDNEAFSGCSGLGGTLYIGKSVSDIGCNAFWRIDDFNDIIMMPGSMVSNFDLDYFDCSKIFSPTVVADAKLRVPAYLVEDYRNSDLWRGFANIIALNEPSAMSFAEAYVEIETGQTKSLKINTEPQYSWADLIYTSSDPAVATVTGDGHVTGIAPGATTITATGGELSATCNITVIPSAQLFELEKDSVDIRIVDGGVNILNAPAMARVIVSALDGRVIVATYAETPELHIPLTHGIYIVKVGDTTTAKILI